MAKEQSDVSTYLTKPATTLQSRFAEYIKTEVGYDPATAKTKAEAFAEGVRLATATRMIFQASDFNREATAAERSAKALAAEAETPAEPKPAKPAKTAPVKKAKAAPAPVVETQDDTDEDAAEEATETPAPAPAKKAAPAKRAPARRAPARVATSEAKAPF
jgi:hypothetical protein